MISTCSIDLFVPPGEAKKEELRAEIFRFYLHTLVRHIRILEVTE